MEATRATVKSQNPKPKAYPTPPPPPRPPVEKPRMRNVGSDGLLTTNCRGVALCRGFQRGDRNSLEEGSSVICGKNTEHLHQRAKCLSPGHGANACSGKAAAPPKGRGEGRGKAGRGAGRRPQY
eukprot:2962224-Alexandrium_andersonii.AAC.1